MTFVSHTMFSVSTGSLIVLSMYLPLPDFSISITVLVLKNKHNKYIMHIIFSSIYTHRYSILRF